MLNVQDYGVVGDGATDDTAALQTLVAWAPDRSALYFPTGHYKVTATIDAGTKGLTVYGDGQGKPANQYFGGSVIRGDVAGPLWKVQYPASGVTFADMGFSNLNPAGIALQPGGNSISLERLSISGYRGIWAPSNTFTMNIAGVQCVWNGFPIGSVGIQVAGHAAIRAADVVGFDHGIRACGLGVDIRSCRIEVNRTGLMLGMDASGNNSNLTGVVVEAISLEANDVGIECRVVTGASIRGVTIQGTVNSPSANSAVGLWVKTAKAIEFANFIISNRYTDAAVKIAASLDGQRYNGILASNVLTGNPVYPAAKVWDIASMKNLVFDQCA